MPTLAEHPTVREYQGKRNGALHAQLSPQPLDAGWLRTLCLEAGADDVGFVDIDSPDLGEERANILQAFPYARTLISFVRRMNRENIRNPARSLANLEFHHSDVNEVARDICRTLEGRQVRAAYNAMGFPMEADNWPERMWVIAHKPVAVAAGLGVMGIHRNVIHPKFGNFILLGTVVLDRAVTAQATPLDYNPCLECKLCVAACPVGAIGSDGHFDFAACYTHNYREFMGGFGDWVENVVESNSRAEYRARVSDSETVSMWQSLSWGSNYKAAYCMAVCPAGEDVIGPFLENRKQFLSDVVTPLQKKEEPVYVIPDTDAEAHVGKRFPHKTVRHVGNGLRATSAAGFLQALPLVFNRHQSAGLNATYHFTFTGAEDATGTVVIRDKHIDVQHGHVGTADLHVTADTTTWLKFLAKERNIAWAIIRRKIRLKGSPKLLLAFGRCFPS